MNLQKDRYGNSDPCSVVACSVAGGTVDVGRAPATFCVSFASKRVVAMSSCYTS